MASQDDAKDEVSETFPELPEHMRELVRQVGFPTFNMPAEEIEVFERAKAGKCMLCEQTLKDETVFSINRYGIVAGFCSGMCHTDMGTLGFLSENLHDLNERVDFRSGNTDADVADEKPDEPDTDEG